MEIVWKTTYHPFYTATRKCDEKGKLSGNLEKIILIDVLVQIVCGVIDWFYLIAFSPHIFSTLQKIKREKKNRNSVQLPLYGAYSINNILSRVSKQLVWNRSCAFIHS